MARRPAQHARHGASSLGAARTSTRSEHPLPRSSEEQERELAPEVEEERQLERPDKAEPRDHTINADVVVFIQTGSFTAMSKAFVPVYESLADSSGRKYLPQLRRRRHSYQRPVQWILTSSSASTSAAGTPSTPSSSPLALPAKKQDGSGSKSKPKPKCTLMHMVIISPYEAQGLMDSIKQSRAVTLHLYAPLLNEGFRSLDRLDLYTVPPLPISAVQPLLLDIPVEVKLELDLFARQLYFKTFAEFEALRQYLLAPPPRSLSPPMSPGGSEAGGGSGSDAVARVMDEDLVGLLNIVMTKMRRNCEAIGKTHIGKALDYRLIAKGQFQE
ncbi:hypothetical protein Micbo1qcDRAFT_210370 [Microdochium bolleyi]|uniref:Uncharacterized protein n=1 Tax=Microdochium bolleyi TaxID=196109 RepID=A0A136IIX8_9PEZI|nr:hypothetical protein Micbo1qcDRAFT_210370 [Microdochium bolleyi]